VKSPPGREISTTTTRRRRGVIFFTRGQEGDIHEACLTRDFEEKAVPGHNYLII